ncbi:MAG: bb3-type cytochrome oxidase subunit IV [Candidatus Binatia bacterium]|nr:MAG: bb3-type cytochrome oxidase subunit IV [Candidatus Binatia bacterium]
MNEAATLRHAAIAEPAESPLTPESWGKLGMWIFLAGDAMTFGALLAAYGASRYGSIDWPHPADVLGIGLTAFMTFLLICSSVTMVQGLAAIQRGDRRGMRNFLLLTILGGSLFLGMQAYEWTHLINEGMGLTSNPWGASLFGTTFFVLTGFHGCHVFGGVVYLSCVIAQGELGHFSAENYRGVEIAGLYWHFVDLVWILVFTFVYLL